MIQDNANLSGMVAGVVATEENVSVDEVQVEMEEMNAHESVFGLTNSDGYYQMQGNYPNGDYRVTATKQDSYTKGVSTLDLVIIQKHLLGILPLNSPYKILAADADNNNAVSANDLFQLRKLILGVQSQLPTSAAWYFISDDYLFSNSQNPWYSGDEDNMYSIIQRDLDTDEMHNDFVAVKIGDVNGSINQLLTQDELLSRSMMSFFTGNQTFKADERVSVPVYASDFDQIAGMQFTLEFDANTFDLAGLTPGVLNIGEDQMALLQDGMLNISWNQASGLSASEDEALFTVELRAKTNGQLINQITMNSNLLDAEVYTDNLEIRRIGFEVRTMESDGFVLYQNTPNPFENETEIVFELPSATFATLKVYDVTGKVLQSVSGEFAKGRNSVSMSKNDLKTSGGVLYYQLETENHNAIRKMILLK
jgi:hypothetical protein